MYRFALALTPDDVEAVAAQLYVEMLEAGFTRVGEFHYLHHDRDGAPYANPVELAERIAGASRQAGIRLTLLPVFYAHSTFGGADPTPGQRRFISGLDQFAAMIESSRSIVSGLPGGVLGVAPHSLRAVTPDELAVVTCLIADGPIHIHAAEQQREVDDCLAWSGQRPVQWLLDHAGVDAHWTLIHATHLDQSETAQLARSGAVVGLCPVTEANLGDGIFPGPAFAEAGGRYGIGTDSNIRISVAEELRQLEYAQRLGNEQRNVMVTGSGSTGRALLERTVVGGNQALGVGPSGIAVGAPADMVGLRCSLWVGDDLDTLLDGWIFASGVEVDTVWVGGEPVVQQGRHRDREEVAQRFRATMRALLARA
jgi:formiminoglutamate deiminase